MIDKFIKADKESVYKKSSDDKRGEKMNDSLKNILKIALIVVTSIVFIAVAVIEIMMYL